MENSQLQLFMLVNPESMLAYPYIAVDRSSRRVISFGQEYIDLSTYYAEEMEMVEKDYLPTSRSLEVDLESLDKVVAALIRKDPYDVVAYVDGSGLCKFRFKGTGEEEELEIATTSLDRKEALASTLVIAELHRLREEAFECE